MTPASVRSPSAAALPDLSPGKPEAAPAMARRLSTAEGRSHEPAHALRTAPASLDARAEARAPRFRRGCRLAHLRPHLT